MDRYQGPGIKYLVKSHSIYIPYQSQTEGLLTRHCSVLQLPIPNIYHYPIQTAQTITHIIVSFVPQPTIIAIIVNAIQIEYMLYSKQCNSIASRANQPEDVPTVLCRARLCQTVSYRARAIGTARASSAESKT